MNIFEEDINSVLEADFIPWDDLQGKTFFITGGTGLIGYTLVTSLLKASEKKNLNIHLLLLVRDIERAITRFQDVLDAVKDSERLQFIESTVEEFSNELVKAFRIDYIIHGASITSSRCFVEKPVETIETAILGTRNMLLLAKEKEVSSFVYLSSMEVYGYPEKGHKVTEEEVGALSPLEVRNSYPISKQMCESMCVSYTQEYNVPVKIIRLTQTFGPRVNYNDERIFAYFIRCMNEKKDIVLRTKGETERSYLYTADAVTAILTVMLKGENGQAYNAANEDTYCSIREMAKSVASNINADVVFEVKNEIYNYYPETIYMNLNTTMLQTLGWKTQCYNIFEMLSRTFLTVKRNE